MNAARKTRARGFTLDPAAVVLTRRLAAARPPAFTLRKTSIRSPPAVKRTAFCDFCSSQSVFLGCPSGYSFRERRRGPLRQNARSIIPCGDTPLFFLSRSFSLPLPFFRRRLNRDNRSTVRERSREISGKISRIYLHVTEAQSGTDL